MEECRTLIVMSSVPRRKEDLEWVEQIGGTAYIMNTWTWA
jgi:hypothetical protein